MKKQKTKENFWLVLGLLNLLGMVYPISSFLGADSTEDQLVAVFILFGIGLVMLIVDSVAIAVAYSQ